MSLEDNSNDHIKDEHFQDGSKKVDVNDLISRLKREASKDKKNNVILSCAAISAVAVFGIILTL